MLRALCSCLCVVLLGLLVSCQKREPERAQRKLSVQLSGCAAWLRGPVCELADDRLLRVIVDLAGHEQVTFATEHGALHARESHGVEGGKRFHLAIPQGATRLDVTVRGVTSEGRFRHALADAHPPAWFRAADAARKAGQTAEATAMATPALAQPGERAWALSLLGRMALRAGDVASGRARLRESSRLHAQAGRSSDAQHDLCAIAFFLFEELSLTEARALLDEAAHLTVPGSDDVTLLMSFQAQLGRATGAFDEALSLLAQVERDARRRGHAHDTLAALWERMNVLRSMGNTRAITELHRTLAREDFGALGACEARNLLLTIRNVRNAIAESLAAGAERAAFLQETEALFGQQAARAPCPDQRLTAGELHEQAHAYLLSGNLAAAEETARRSMAAVGERPFRALSLEACYLRGRIALEQGDSTRAHEEFRRMEALSDGERWLEPRASALAHQALALTRSAQPAAALASYERMEAVLDQLVDKAPLGADGIGLSAALERHSATHAALLIAEARTKEALDLALRARTRRARLLLSRARLAEMPEARRAAWTEAVARVQLLRRESDALDERAWQLDSEARRALEQDRERVDRAAMAAIEQALHSLGTEPVRDLKVPTLADDELLFTVLTAGAQSTALVRRGERSMAQPLSAQAGEPGARAAAWLTQLAPLLEGVRRLYVLSPDELEGVDLHALPFSGEPLASRLEVAYSQGQPERDYRVPTPTSVLVVADPSGDLPGARAEAAWLTRALATELGGAPKLLPRATAALLREELAQRDVFHFAGHTRFDAQRPWRLALLLADDAAFGLSDLLALPKAPPLVVLSACEGARASAGNAIGTALVAAGSRVVVAPTRTVADALALRFTQAFYAALARERDPVHAAHVAQEALRQAGAGDWAAFRVLVP